MGIGLQGILILIMSSSDFLIFNSLIDKMSAPSKKKMLCSIHSGIQKKEINHSKRLKYQTFGSLDSL